MEAKITGRLMQLKLILYNPAARDYMIILWGGIKDLEYSVFMTQL